MSTIYHLLDERADFSETKGGAIARWAANVLRNGDEIVVCPSFDASWGFPQQRLFELPKWSGVGTYHAVLYRLPWTLQRTIYLSLFEPLLKRLTSGDVVYVHNRPACAAVLASVAEEYGIRVTLHMHNSMLLEANKGQLRELRKIPIVYCSKFLRHEVDQAYPEHFKKAHIVYNGADEGKFFPQRDRTPANVPTVVFTGRLVPYKGVHVLMKAMKILQQQGIRVKCRIVGASWFGGGKKTQYVKKLMQETPENCELVGYRSGDAFAAELRGADIFCCPSIWNDPFPLAPLEGMAAGLPVVASNVGGLPEALAHGGGLLIPPDNEEILANALRTLICNEGLREQMAHEARAAFEKHFLWSNVRQQYLSVIDELAA